jgi:O-antigen/teichoic acid export membrane protein
MNAREQLIGALRGSVAVRVVSLFAMLASSIVLARAMGPTEYGIYSRFFAISSLLLIPAQFGVPILLMRETAQADAMNQLRSMKGLWKWASIFLIKSSISICGLAVLGTIVLATNLDRSSIQVFYMSLLLIPLLSFSDAAGGVVRGLKHIVLAQFPESIVRPLLLPVLVSMLWVAHKQVSAASAMAMNVTSTMTTLLIVIAILNRVKPPDLSYVSADYAQRSLWRHAAMSLALISGLQLFNQQIGIILLGAFRPEADVGIYRVASSASTLALLGSQTVILVVAPHMASLCAEKDIRRVKKLTGISTILSVSVSLPILLAFLLGGKMLVTFLYGQNYASAWTPLMILIAGQTIGTAFGPAGQLLNMSGHEREAFVWLVLVAMINIVLTIALIPSFGMFGAAWATAATTAIWGLASWHLVRKHIGVSGGLIRSTQIAWLESSRFYQRWRLSIKAACRNNAE